MVCVRTRQSAEPHSITGEPHRRHALFRRPADEALHAIDSEQGLKINPAVIRKLVDLGILGKSI